MRDLEFSLWYQAMSGEKRRIIYLEDLKDGENKFLNVLHILGTTINLEDTIVKSDSRVEITRKITGEQEVLQSECTDGIAFGMDILFEKSGKQLRYGIPSCQYSSGEAGKHTYTEERLTAPMIMAYDEGLKTALALVRTKTAKYTCQEVRPKRENNFLHKTDVGSMGYVWECNEGNWFALCWPYEEADKSVALDSKGTPMQAFYPLKEAKWEMELRYDILLTEGETFTDSLYHIFSHQARSIAGDGNDVVTLPFGREEGILYREKSLMGSYREFEEEGAGFFFHFDPLKGYGSEPSGFGTSFNTIPHSTYLRILEYGFTGRQNNAALILAKEKGGEWMEKGEKVIEFFLKNCVMENGWVYSLYDLERQKPFCSFGDSEAPKLHYMDYQGAQGNYLRTMTEPMNDVLESYLWYWSKGKKESHWLEYVEKYAKFLLGQQNEDGSWYRAYDQNGEPVFMMEEDVTEEKGRERGRKAATAIPVAFLCNLAKCMEEEGLHSKAALYQTAAVRAGTYILSKTCNEELYQGGTLDNPNVVDKEAAQYAMAACWILYETTGEERFLNGAVISARQFVTWNYIWNAPVKGGTILYEKGFKTKGMGAINSIWCGGVVDIYSLFHIRELYLTGEASKDRFLMEVAEWISYATHQVMSWPGDDMGFTDIGMQPEGFGICPQGIDEGMIGKGDIWGTLGWIYSAGIDGVSRYLREAKPESFSRR